MQPNTNTHLIVVTDTEPIFLQIYMP